MALPGIYCRCCLYNIPRSCRWCLIVSCTVTEPAGLVRQLYSCSSCGLPDLEHTWSNLSNLLCGYTLAQQLSPLDSSHNTPRCRLPGPQTPHVSCQIVVTPWSVEGIWGAGCGLVPRWVWLLSPDDISMSSRCLFGHRGQQAERKCTCVCVLVSVCCSQEDQAIYYLPTYQAISLTQLGRSVSFIAKWLFLLRTIM